jgi:hypothetical protein
MQYILTRYLIFQEKKLPDLALSKLVTFFKIFETVKLVELVGFSKLIEN